MISLHPNSFNISASCINKQLSNKWAVPPAGSWRTNVSPLAVDIRDAISLITKKFDSSPAIFLFRCSLCVWGELDMQRGIGSVSLQGRRQGSCAFQGRYFAGLPYRRSFMQIVFSGELASPSFRSKISTTPSPPTLLRQRLSPIRRPKFFRVKGLHHGPSASQFLQYAVRQLHPNSSNMLSASRIPIPPICCPPVAIPIPPRYAVRQLRSQFLQYAVRQLRSQFLQYAGRTTGGRSVVQQLPNYKRAACSTSTGPP